MFIDLKKILLENDIQPKGVIHVGAHKGLEISEYEKYGFSDVIFIEANPEVFPYLEEIKSNICKTHNYCVAISDYIGEVDFYITSDNAGGGEMSSSLLKLKNHKLLYPNITEKKSIKVKCTTLNNFVKDENIDLQKYNMLNFDIQGAELMALSGANQVLPYVDVINTEVNRSELYENCAIIHEIENFLSDFGFVKILEDFKYSSEWGDAIFIKRK